MAQKYVDFNRSPQEKKLDFLINDLNLSPFSSSSSSSHSLASPSLVSSPSPLPEETTSNYGGSEEIPSTNDVTFNHNGLEEIPRIKVKIPKPVNNSENNNERVKHTWIIIGKKLFIFKILNEENNWYLKCQMMNKKNEEKSERRTISYTQAQDFLATINNRKKLQRNTHKLAKFVFELPDTKLATVVIDLPDPKCTRCYPDPDATQ